MSDQLPPEPPPFDEPPITVLASEVAAFEPERPDLPKLARIPHLGHALLMGAILFAFILLTQGVAAGIILSHRSSYGDAARAAQDIIPLLANPKVQLACLASAYLLSLLVAWFAFPRLWHRSFASGIEWNFAAARRYAVRIIPAGIVLSLIVQALQTLITQPKNAPIEDFFRTQSDVWLVTLFGTFLAPLTEEIFFRGFLFPAIAIGFDWITLKREPAAYLAWTRSTNLTVQSLVFAGFISSGFFAAVHATQLAYSWRSVAVLMCVSFVLTAVRATTKSVAASTLFHACYNFTVFFNLFLQTGGYRHLDKLTQ